MAADRTSYEVKHVGAGPLHIAPENPPDARGDPDDAVAVPASPAYVVDMPEHLRPAPLHAAPRPNTATETIAKTPAPSPAEARAVVADSNGVFPGALARENAALRPAITVAPFIHHDNGPAPPAIDYANAKILPDSDDKNGPLRPTIAGDNGKDAAESAEPPAGAEK